MTFDLNNFQKSNHKIFLVFSGLSTIYESEKLPESMLYVRGKKSHLKSDFFNEVSAAMQFPHYFGENWSAYEDLFKEFLVNNPKKHIIFSSANELFLLEPYNFKIFLDVLFENQNFLKRNKILLHTSNLDFARNLITIFTDNSIDLGFIDR